MWRVPTDPDSPRSVDPDREKVNLLGVRIDPLRLPDLLAEVITRARQRRKSTVLYVNVHCMNVAERDSRYAQILNHADIVYCDGTGVRLAVRLSGQRLPARMTAADFIDDLCLRAERQGLSLFFLGGAAGSAEAAAKELRRRHPDLRILGTAEGFEVGPEVVHRINSLGPDILLVGMGTPTQEKWIDARRNELDAPVVWAVGALFDFVSGRIPRGPEWLTEHGFEWVCRLAAEPKKLWRRYLIGNPYFFWRVIRRVFSL